MDGIKFIIPQDAQLLDSREDLLSGDLLMILRSGLPPFKIKASVTGLLNLLTVGEPTLPPLEGDKKIIEDVEYTFLSGEWKALSSQKTLYSFDVISGNGGRCLTFKGTGVQDYILKRR